MQTLYYIYHAAVDKNRATQIESQRFDFLFAIKTYFNYRMRW